MKDSERFNKDFFTKAIVDTGKGLEAGNNHKKRQTRNHDCGHYYEVAYFVHHYFPGLRMIEVGSGMGWITQHLKRRNQKVVGFDVGQWAADHAVCKDIFCDDLLTIDTRKWRRQLVICSNVMSYFEKDEVPQAIEQLGKLFSRYAVVTVQTKENFIKNWGEKALEIEVARRTLESWDWWKEQFAAKGLILGEKHYQIVNDPKTPVRLVPKGDGRPSLFILEHQK
jgi:hypothetical protein